jgi:hypothetical protein
MHLDDVELSIHLDGLQTEQVRDALSPTGRQGCQGLPEDAASPSQRL